MALGGLGAGQPHTPGCQRPGTAYLQSPDRPMRTAGAQARSSWGCSRKEEGGWACGPLGAEAGLTPYLSKSTDTRSMATITDSLSGAAGLGSDALPGLTFSFPETRRSGCYPARLDSLCRQYLNSHRYSMTPRQADL